MLMMSKKLNKNKEIIQEKKSSLFQNINKENKIDKMNKGNNLNTIKEKEDRKNETISIKEANESLFYFDNDKLQENNYYKPKIKK